MIDFTKTIVPAFEITRAESQKYPVVALESAVITHGLPRPQNLTLAQDMEQAVREEGAIPVTIGVVDGKVLVGMGRSELERLAYADGAIKVSQRNYAAALLKGTIGGTTVAGTMFAANKVGIQVLATGGIGGVHQSFVLGGIADLHVEQRFDVSNDLKALSEIPMIVVCAGAKSVLDLPATVEYLETMGVPTGVIPV